MPLDQSELGYVVDHSASIYLIDTNGELMGQFKHGISEKEIVSGVIYAYGKR
jgi:cytochrome oxidase Cu insertion factor (SCO1/SenC/PrrC family)